MEHLGCHFLLKPPKMALVFLLVPGVLSTNLEKRVRNKSIPGVLVNQTRKKSHKHTKHVHPAVHVRWPAHSKIHTWPELRYAALGLGYRSSEV